MITITDCLPAEAQWEMSCRAGSRTAYVIGNETVIRQKPLLMKGYAVCELSRNDACRSRRPNAWGLFDMRGNVGEWCQDWFDDLGPDRSIVDPQGPKDRGARNGRVVSGGYHKQQPLVFRSGRVQNYGGVPAMQVTGLGFRVARLLPV